MPSTPCRSMPAGNPAAASCAHRRRSPRRFRRQPAPAGSSSTRSENLSCTTLRVLRSRLLTPIRRGAAGGWPGRPIADQVQILRRRMPPTARTGHDGPPPPRASPIRVRGNMRKIIDAPPAPAARASRTWYGSTMKSLRIAGMPSGASMAAACWEMRRATRRNATVGCAGYRGRPAARIWVMRAAQSCAGSRPVHRRRESAASRPRWRVEAGRRQARAPGPAGVCPARRSSAPIDSRRAACTTRCMLDRAISSRKPLVSWGLGARIAAAARAIRGAWPLSMAAPAVSIPEAMEAARPAMNSPRPHCNVSAARCGPRSRASNTACKSGEVHGGIATLSDPPSGRATTQKSFGWISWRRMLPAGHIESHERPNRRRFVPAGGAVHHPRALDRPAGQGPGHQFRRRLIVGADQLKARRRRVGERTEQVEDGAHAERRADRREGFHRRVKIRGRTGR